MSAPNDSPTAADAVPFRRESHMIPPFPADWAVNTLGGVTTILRWWDDGDERRCRLCAECTAKRGVCGVMTEEVVTEDEAPLYSSRGLDFVDDRGVNRAPFGLVGG